MLGHWIFVIGIIAGCIALPKKDATSRECFAMSYVAIGILFIEVFFGLGIKIGTIKEILSLEVEHKLSVGVALCYGFGIGQFIVGLIKKEKELNQSQ
jgi:hypothetical protein